MKNIIFALLILAISACTPASNGPTNEGLVISDAIVRTPLGGQNMTAGYFQITNHSNIDDALIAVESPVAKRIEMHATQNLDGKMTMRRQVTVDINAGETIYFKPGGLHLMLFDVDITKDQVDAALTLKFKQADDLTVIADVADIVPASEHH